ncbi:hypothetical protein GE061_005057 [Apolygus lucorum]|uniref:Uncharacterized protein n=1 Tax=Apolygus lucorum TaxID=248454 RepID=A0A8S9WWK8_APOLU|nr:hypothetical protein GE061_005057 [Apolygus lucorum]
MMRLLSPLAQFLFHVRFSVPTRRVPPEDLCTVVGIDNQEEQKEHLLRSGGQSEHLWRNPKALFKPVDAVAEDRDGVASPETIVLMGSKVEIDGFVCCLKDSPFRILRNRPRKLSVLV